jgi:hypothetical protein
VDDPDGWLTTLAPLVLESSGRIVLSVPHTADLITRAKAGRVTPTPGSGSTRAVLRPVGARHVRAWLRRAGFRTISVHPRLGARRSGMIGKIGLGGFRGVLAQRFLVEAVRPPVLSQPRAGVP